MKRCSMSHVIREKDTSTHLLKCPNLRTSTTSNASEASKAMETLIHCWQECKMVQPLWERQFGSFFKHQKKKKFSFFKKNKQTKAIVCLSVQFSSVAQSCPTLCDSMNHSTPGLPVHYQLPEFTQTHVHRVGDAIQPSHPLLSPSPPAPNPSQHQGLFQ